MPTTIETLEMLSTIVAEAHKDGCIVEDASMVIEWKGVDLRISISVDKGD